MYQISRQSARKLKEIFILSDKAGGEYTLKSKESYIPFVVKRIDENDNFVFYSLAYSISSNGKNIVDHETELAQSKADPYFILIARYKSDVMKIDRNIIVFNEDGSLRFIPETSESFNIWIDSLMTNIHL